MQLTATPPLNRTVAAISWNPAAGDDEGRSHSLFLTVGPKPLATLAASTTLEGATQVARTLVTDDSVLAVSHASDGAWLVYQALQGGSTNGMLNGAPLSSRQVPWSDGENYHVVSRDAELRALVSASKTLAF